MSTLSDEEEGDREEQKSFDTREAEDASCCECGGIVEKFPFGPEADDGKGEEDEEEESKVFCQGELGEPRRKKGSTQE